MQDSFKIFLYFTIDILRSGFSPRNWYWAYLYSVKLTHQYTSISLVILENTLNDTGVINTVTAILASYRGFDTMGEVVVIFTAGVGVLCLLKREECDE